ncbi:hypothetical protein K458DRAFT_24991 [Lentithecium fluviatile CBS 122367]|uniref:Uncharacterized protein n=1 Tax=Lentithecium fluviatile CBS 122367 TaxID=1168545 RepID=A0A6G1J5I1_9PLEO|nr:hypothetical protein K458DRAFT_24991 [Lentithecium fluviatile CBS 122367]
MIAQFFDLLVSRRRKNSLDQEPATPPTVGHLIGPFDRKLCWEATGTPRSVYLESLGPNITAYLDEHFGCAPGNDHITISMYMIGDSVGKALPTLLFISKNPDTRREARKAIKESGIMSRFPDFQTKYVSKDPGSVKIEPLASGDGPLVLPLSPKVATEAYIDITKPLCLLGMPVYVRHSTSIRTATANVVRVRDRIFLQTANHVFYENFPDLANLPYPDDDELEIDSDSDSDTDDNNDDEVSVAITSIASASPDTWSDRASSNDSAGSRRSSIFSDVPTPKLIYQPRDTDAMLHDAATKLASFTDKQRKFASKELAAPSPESLHPVGRLFHNSVPQDVALIEITDKSVEDSLLRAMDREEAPAIAYSKIANGPREGATVYAYTASSEILTGSISATSSYMRLVHSSSFQEVYAVRFNGPLYQGVCGSAVIDARTGETYGHLVAGCRTTGMACILAASQIANFLAEAPPSEISMEDIANSELLTICTQNKGMLSSSDDISNHSVQHILLCISSAWNNFLLNLVLWWEVLKTWVSFLSRKFRLSNPTDSIEDHSPPYSSFLQKVTWPFSPGPHRPRTKLFSPAVRTWVAYLGLFASTIVLIIFGIGASYLGPNHPNVRSTILLGCDQLLMTGRTSGLISALCGAHAASLLSLVLFAIMHKLSRDYIPAIVRIIVPYSALCITVAYYLRHLENLGTGSDLGFGRRSDLIFLFASMFCSLIFLCSTRYAILADRLWATFKIAILLALIIIGAAANSVPTRVHKSPASHHSTPKDDPPRPWMATAIDWVPALALFVLLDMGAFLQCFVLLLEALKSTPRLNVTHRVADCPEYLAGCGFRLAFYATATLAGFQVILKECIPGVKLPLNSKSSILGKWTNWLGATFLGTVFSYTLCYGSLPVPGSLLESLGRRVFASELPSLDSEIVCWSFLSIWSVILPLQDFYIVHRRNSVGQIKSHRPWSPRLGPLQFDELSVAIKRIHPCIRASELDILGLRNEMAGSKVKWNIRRQQYWRIGLRLTGLLLGLSCSLFRHASPGRKPIFEDKPAPVLVNYMVVALTGCALSALGMRLVLGCCVALYGDARFFSDTFDDWEQSYFYPLLQGLPLLILIRDCVVQLPSQNERILCAGLTLITPFLLVSFRPFQESYQFLGSISIQIVALAGILTSEIRWNHRLISGCSTSSLQVSSFQSMGMVEQPSMLSQRLQLTSTQWSAGVVLLFWLNIAATTLFVVKPLCAVNCIRDFRYAEALRRLTTGGPFRPRSSPEEACQMLIQLYTTITVEGEVFRAMRHGRRVDSDGFHDTGNTEETDSTKRRRCDYQDVPVDDFAESISSDIVMGINTFLIKETENWKRKDSVAVMARVAINRADGQIDSCSSTHVARSRINLSINLIDSNSGRGSEPPTSITRTEPALIA